MTRHRNAGIRKRCRCPRKAWNKCPHPWHANYSCRGRCLQPHPLDDRGRPSYEHRVSLHVFANKPTTYLMLKTEAEHLADEWRRSLFLPAPEPTPQPEQASAFTLDRLAELYLKNHVHVPTRRPRAAKEKASQVQTICRADVALLDGRVVRLGALPVMDVTKPVIEAFRRMRRDQVAADRDCAQGDPKDTEVLAAVRRLRVASKGGEVSTNRLLAELKHLLRWAVAEELIEDVPRGLQAVKANGEVEGPRRRRLEGDEETRLLAAAQPHLRAMIEVALETGMRRGEILGLQWQHVDLDRGVLMLPETLTKTRRARAVGISARLKAILEMRRTDKWGRAYPVTAHVFGNDFGERIGRIGTAWTATCRRAGITGLQFRDLRREAGSRVIEAGLSLLDAKDYLGHSRATMTDTYLAQSVTRQRSVIQRLEQARQVRTNFAHDPESGDEADQPADTAKAPNSIN